MKTAMEMHDSIILKYEHDEAGNCTLLFYAVVFRSDGDPGRSLPQENGWQNIRMRFTGAVLEGKIRDGEPYASDGSLWIDGSEHRNMIPFPLTQTGDILLSMVLSDDFAGTTIRASSISIEAEGEFEQEYLWNEDGTLTRSQG